MNGWKEDKAWSDKLLPEIKQILGLYLIGEAPECEDCERNTDLIVLKMEPVRIACRIRRYRYFSSYPDDITIRAERPSGMKSELTKIIEGWGNYFFYGFATEDERRLAGWKLCDLNAFRLYFNRKIIKTGLLPGMERKNGDGSSVFRVFRAVDIPNFVVKQG